MPKSAHTSANRTVWFWKKSVTARTKQAAALGRLLRDPPGPARKRPRGVLSH